jgi:hypothetical protein
LLLTLFEFGDHLPIEKIIPCPGLPEVASCDFGRFPFWGSFALQAIFFARSTDTFSGWRPLTYQNIIFPSQGCPESQLVASGVFLFGAA